MKIEEQLKKATAESEYWFQKFNSADADLTYHIATLASADAMAAEFRQKCISLSTRLELICDIQRAIQKTGAPLPSWLIGGVVEEKLKELLKEAKGYEKPFSFNPVTFHFERPHGVKIPRGLETYILTLETSIRELVEVIRRGDKK
ncbi:hypothetical protein HWC07_gp106 [Pantoea phage vB_PagM_LIET2]|uniref:Uncharacterized protein n=1 Tax=Pantoea phage vB_PagM_LIET2 TaxID=2508071 RepID=A0A411AW86_9CAUD|nr:hypothetical protein HWC07_gp106 [Pantoea phage vB_PagM_LIET2]QAX92358.1 hypothetical protein LIET2_gp106 [Pantoea phage vB_PagM_LIET2]